MIVIAPILVGALTFGAVALATSRRQATLVRRRLVALVEPRQVVELEAPEQAGFAARRERLFAATEPRLRSVPVWTRVESLVERADVRLRPIELFYATLGGLALLGLLALAIGVSPAGVLLLAVLALAAMRIALGIRIERRKRAFEQQLPELLSALASAMRAGHGLSQSLQAVAEDASEPAAKEFGRVLAEARLGRPLEESLVALGDRIGSDDLNFVLEAIVTQRQVGGSLAGIFEIVGDSVRQRQQFTLRIRALTAMGRTSALVLIGLPIVLALVLSVMSRGYLSPLFETGAGHVMLFVSAFLLVTGSVWLHRIVAFKG